MYDLPTLGVGASDEKDHSKKLAHIISKMCNFTLLKSHLHHKEYNL